VHPHPRQAVFVYHWSSFPGNRHELLTKYYDAMLYMANWGSRQLMFRFPRAALDLERAMVYCQPLIVQDYVSFSTVGEYAILNIDFYDEEGGGWVEGEGWLPAMLSLRDDILRGDYRTLYLAWLKALEVEDLLDSIPEPPVPPGLKALSPALHTMVEFFEIDEMLIRVAAEVSSERKPRSKDWLRRALFQLAAEERDAYLFRLAQGEPHLSGELNRRLSEISPLPEPELPPPRTVGQLLREAEERRQQEERRRAEEAEARRIEELEALASHEAEAWADVDALIQQTNARAYDGAVQLLVKLRDLAEYQGRETYFQGRLNTICEEYRRRPALHRRLRNAGLYQS
jgi:hypothetical protein